MGVYFRVLCFSMGLCLHRRASDSDGVIQMISTTYFNWARDNKSLVSIKLKNFDAHFHGKIKRVWWDDYEDRVEFVGEDGVTRMMGTGDVLELNFL